VLTRRQARSLVTIGLLISGGATACLDSRRGDALGARAHRFTHADSVRALLEAPERPNLEAFPGESCDASATLCPAFVGASPGFFQGYNQPSVIELTFAGPVGAISVQGRGAISCDPGYGTLVGYGADGAVVGSVPLTLIDPGDCSPENNPDNVTFGAQATLLSTTPIVLARILPMTHLSFPVFDLVGHASANYTVTYGRGPIPLEPPKLLVSCLPSPVVRGQTVTCKGELKNGPAYTVVERRAKGKGFTITEAPNEAVAAGQSFEWSGVAVAKTEVRFKISYIIGTDTKTVDEKATFDIAPRGWLPMLLTAAPQFHISLYPPFLIEYPTNHTFGFFWFEDPMPEIAPGAQVAGGPNDGLWYFADAIPMPQDIHAFTHPGMYAGQTTGVSWYNDQNGRGSGTCTQAVLPQLAGMAEVHEGVTMAANSHYGVANRVFRDEALQVKFEELYTSSSQAELQRKAHDIYQQFRTKKYDPEQAKFDAVDTPRIFGSLGCRLDFNPNDK